MHINRLILILCCWLLKKALVIATSLNNPEFAPGDDIELLPKRYRYTSLYIKRSNILLQIGSNETGL